MDFIEPPAQEPEKGFTLTISRSARNGAIAKILILMAFALLAGHFYARDAAREYELGLERIQTGEVERTRAYEAELSAHQRNSNLVFASFIMLLGLGIFFGAYELLALLVGFLIGKVIRW